MDQEIENSFLEQYKRYTIRDIVTTTAWPDKTMYRSPPLHSHVRRPRYVLTPWTAPEPAGLCSNGLLSSSTQFRPPGRGTNTDRSGVLLFWRLFIGRARP